MTKAETTLAVLDLFIAGALTYERAKEVRTRVAEMVAEGRDPTREELLEVLNGIDAAVDDIVAADDRLNPKEGD